MFRLTRQTDYGIVLMTHMASDRHRATHTARALAENTGLSPPMVSKILKLLARVDLLESHRGVKGGYSLAKRPDQITVADLIAALDGPIAVTECSAEGPSTCEHETGCQVRSNWRRINQAVTVALENLTLADMTRPDREQTLLSIGSAPARSATLETV